MKVETRVVPLRIIIVDPVRSVRSYSNGNDAPVVETNSPEGAARRAPL